MRPYPYDTATKLMLLYEDYVDAVAKYSQAIDGQRKDMIERTALERCGQLDGAVSVLTPRPTFGSSKLFCQIVKAYMRKLPKHLSGCKKRFHATVFVANHFDEIMEACADW